MIHNVTDLQIGRIIYLYPHTKQASRACHLQLTVAVMKDPAAHWPMVMVTWKEDNEDRWELVHRDNIRLRRASNTTSKAEIQQGDTTHDGERPDKWARVKRMPGRAKPIEIPGGQEQATLF